MPVIVTRVPVAGERQRAGDVDRADRLVGLQVVGDRSQTGLYDVKLGTSGDRDGKLSPSRTLAPTGRSKTPGRSVAALTNCYTVARRSPIVAAQKRRCLMFRVT